MANQHKLPIWDTTNYTLTALTDLLIYSAMVEKVCDLLDWHLAARRVNHGRDASISLAVE